MSMSTSRFVKSLATAKIGEWKASGDTNTIDEKTADENKKIALQIFNKVFRQGVTPGELMRAADPEIKKLRCTMENRYHIAQLIGEQALERCYIKPKKLRPPKKVEPAADEKEIAIWGLSVDCLSQDAQKVILETNDLLKELIKEELKIREFYLKQFPEDRASVRMKLFQHETIAAQPQEFKAGSIQEVMALEYNIARTAYVLHGLSHHEFETMFDNEWRVDPLFTIQENNEIVKNYLRYFSELLKNFCDVLQKFSEPEKIKDKLNFYSAIHGNLSSKLKKSKPPRLSEVKDSLSAAQWNEWIKEKLFYEGNALLAPSSAQQPRRLLKTSENGKVELDLKAVEEEIEKLVAAGKEATAVAGAAVEASEVKALVSSPRLR